MISRVVLTCLPRQPQSGTATVEYGVHVSGKGFAPLFVIAGCGLGQTPSPVALLI
jgi:hypothetical protein